MAGRIAPVQHPFDKRIQTMAMPMQDTKYQIQRGFMIQDQPFPGYANSNAGKFVFNYLYNPSTIQAMYQVQTSGGALSYLYPNPGDAAYLAVPINQSASWTVMFDRTYELNSGAFNPDGTINPKLGNTAVPASNNITADPNVYGVWADVLQLQYFTGMMLQGSQAQGQQGLITGLTNPSGSGTVSFSANQGFMMMVPCWAFFGSQHSINYYGYISEWDVTYTHFSQYMVPMRCVVDITFTMLPPPAGKKNSGYGSAGYYGTTQAPGTTNAGGRG